MYLNFRISASCIPYNVREAELGSRPVARRCRAQSLQVQFSGSAQGEPFSRPGRVDTSASARSGGQ
jgi:hypothetical protein